MRELALFAGVGGGILGGRLLGWRTVCAVEIAPFCREILLRRQLDGCLPRFPIWDDVRTFDGKPWRGCVDVISGGFPCQDISCANHNGRGLDGERSGLWSEFARIIGEIKPAYVLIENSPNLRSKGLDRVLKDLASMGYDAEWGVVSAADAIWDNCHPCADHLRKRMWILAWDNRKISYSNSDRGGSGNSKDDFQTSRAIQSNGAGKTVADLDGAGRGEQWRAFSDEKTHEASERGGWWSSEPGMDRVVDGFPGRVDRVRALGNAQVPAVAQLAWETLTGEDHATISEG